MIAVCPKHGVKEAVERTDGDLYFVCGHIVWSHPPLDIPVEGNLREHGQYDKLDGVKGASSDFRGVLNLPRGK